MLEVSLAAEQLDAVVGAVVHLHVVELRARAAAGEREAVELVVGAELEAGELDAHVLEAAAVVSVVGAAVRAPIAERLDIFELRPATLMVARPAARRRPSRRERAGRRRLAA